MSDHITLKNGEKKLVVKLADFIISGFQEFEEYVRKEFDKEPGVRADAEGREAPLYGRMASVGVRDRPKMMLSTRRRKPFCLAPPEFFL